MKCGYLARSPFAVRLRSSPGSSRPPQGKRHLTRLELRALLDLLRSETEDGRSGWRLWKARRLNAMVATAIFTGLPQGELLHLRMEDVASRTESSAWFRGRQRPQDGAIRTARADRRGPGPLPRNVACPSVRPHGFPTEPVPWLWPACRGLSPWVEGPPGHKPSINSRPPPAGPESRVRLASTCGEVLRHIRGPRRRLRDGREDSPSHGASRIRVLPTGRYRQHETGRLRAGILTMDDETRRSIRRRAAHGQSAGFISKAMRIPLSEVRAILRQPVRVFVCPSDQDGFAYRDTSANDVALVELEARPRSPRPRPSSCRSWPPPRTSTRPRRR